MGENLQEFEQNLKFELSNIFDGACQHFGISLDQLFDFELITDWCKKGMPKTNSLPMWLTDIIITKSNKINAVLPKI